MVHMPCIVMIIIFRKSDQMFKRLEQFYSFSVYQLLFITWAVSIVLAVDQKIPSSIGLAMIGTFCALFLIYFFRSVPALNHISISTNIFSLIAIAVITWCFSFLQYPYFKILFLSFDGVLASILLWIAVLFGIAYKFKWNENPQTQNIKSIVIFFLLIFVGLFWVRCAYDVGFEKLYLFIDKSPDRLRDITFQIWDAHSFKEHWGRVFYSFEDFAQSKAYGGHSLPYLLLLYLFNSLTQLSENLSFRLVAIVEMLILIVSITLVIKSELSEVLKKGHGVVLVILGLGFCATSPLFWISAGKSNIDNPFFLYSGILVALSYLMAHEIRRTAFITYFLIALSALLFPLLSVLLGLYWITMHLHRADKSDINILKLAVWQISLSLIVYAYGPLVIMMNGLESSSSTWMFRSGLDGDTYEFLNIFQAVISPSYPRPFTYLAMPLIIVILQLTIMFFYRKSHIEDVKQKIFSKGMFLGGVGSAYFGTLLFWPQSISVHPYLYDFIGLLPFYILILLNFGHKSISSKTWVIWIFVLAVAIQSNLTGIAQAGKCPTCLPDLPTNCGIANEFLHYKDAGSCSL
jgi:hypothetical protein